MEEEEEKARTTTLKKEVKMASGLFYELIAILEGECWHDLLAVFFH